MMPTNNDFDFFFICEEMAVVIFFPGTLYENKYYIIFLVDNSLVVQTALGESQLSICPQLFL